MEAPISSTKPEDAKADITTVEDIEVGKDTPGGKHVNGNAFLVNRSTGEIRLIPVPTENPNDPLNYSLWQKSGLVVVCCWFCK